MTDKIHPNRRGLSRRLALLALGAVGLGPAVAAAPAPEAIPAPATALDAEPLQIVVFEAPDCVYCTLFRRYVEPAYAASARAQNMPMRFVDLNEPGAGNVTLASPVDQVPTAVLIQNNREIGRVPGYVGPETFFHAINHILATAN
ncbi:MAG: thioredoxin family protein [Hyphomicrobiaceae bacterium]